MSHVCYTSPLISASHSLVQLNFANKYDYCTYNLILNSLWFQGVNFVLQEEVVAASKKMTVDLCPTFTNFLVKTICQYY